MAAAEYVRKLTDSEGGRLLNDRSNREHFNTEMFHGFDFDATMLRIGSTNMMLHGIEQPIIKARDSVSDNLVVRKTFMSLKLDGLIMRI